MKRKVNDSSFFTSWSKKVVPPESVTTPLVESIEKDAAYPDVQLLSLQSSESDVADEEPPADAELPYSSLEQTTSGASAEDPPHPKKICHAENILNRTILALNTDNANLKQGLSKNAISNPEEMKKALK